MKKRKEIRAQLRWIDGTRLSSQRYPNTPEGRAALIAWKHEKTMERKHLLDGLEIPIKSTLFIEFSKQWMADQIEEHPKSTWADYESRLRNHILPAFGHRSLHSIKKSEVEKFLVSLKVKKGLHQTTVNHVRALLHQVFNAAIESEPPRCKENPVTHVKKFKGYDVDEKPDVFSKEECAEYLLAARDLNPTFYTAVMILVNTGIREGELLAVTYGDIDLRNREMTISKVREARSKKIRHSTKSGRNRTLGINDALEAALVERMKSTRHTLKNSFVICHEETGKSYTPSAMNHWHRKTLKDAGLKEIRVHDLRHTFASLYMMNGGSRGDLQGLLGHSSERMTQRYTHFTPGYLKKKASVVSIQIETEPKKVVRLGKARR